MWDKGFGVRVRVLGFDLWLKPGSGASSGLGLLSRGKALVGATGRTRFVGTRIVGRTKFVGIRIAATVAVFN